VCATEARAEEAFGTGSADGCAGCGFAIDLWTLEQVAHVIERLFGVNYHPGRV
jgi:hypothetical protein